MRLIMTDDGNFKNPRGDLDRSRFSGDTHRVHAALASMLFNSIAPPTVATSYEWGPTTKCRARFYEYNSEDFGLSSAFGWPGEKVPVEGDDSDSGFFEIKKKYLIFVNKRNY